MSATSSRVPLEQARTLADSLVGLLGWACERIEVAGSIRRGRLDVGDIDLVCAPKVRPLTDMFGEPTSDEIDALHDRLCDLERLGTIEKRRNKLGHASWGKELKRAVFHGLSVDIQAVHDPDTWGAWLVIRTGPADFNKALVTPRWQGGLLPPGFEFKDGFQLYRAGGRIPTPTEESLFSALGLPWIAPEARR